MKKFTLISLLTIVVFSTTLAQQPTLQWDKRFNGPAANDKGNAITLDASGNVYVTGPSDGVGTGTDFLTIKYNQNGDTLWTRRHSSNGNVADIANVIKVDDSGNVYVAGGSQAMGIITVKYNSNGIKQWALAFGGGNANNEAYDLEVDVSGNVYVVGRADPYTLLFKINSTGQFQWSKGMPGDPNHKNFIAISNYDGNIIYVGGNSYYTAYYIDALNPSNGDYVQAYNTHTGLNYIKGFPNALVLDGLGNIYVTSTFTENNSTAPHYVTTAKFAYPGQPNESWSWWFSSFVTISGQTMTGTDTKIDAGLNLYVLSDFYTGSYHKYHIKKYRPSDAMIWTATYNNATPNSDNTPVSLALNKLINPEIFVTGTTGTGDITTVKFDNNLNQLWDVVYDCGNNGIDYASTMVMDNCDNVFITGYSNCSGTNQDVKTLKYSALTPTITPDGPTTFCQEDSVKLTASTANNYQWSNGATTQSITVSSSGNYSVSITNANGCSATSLATSVTVNPLPSVGANASVMSVCVGLPVTLTGSGASTYTWSNGVLNGVPFVPTATTTYTVTGTDTNTGCQNTATKTITLNPLPSVGANASVMSVCFGSNTPVTLTGIGANTYTWSNGVLNGVPFVPTATTTYTVTGTDTNTSCQNTATKTITVNPLPSVGANASVMSVCVGSNTLVTLTGIGANTYTWSNGVLNGVSFVPTATTTYTVVGTETNTGCQNTATKTITINTLPSVSANASVMSVCVGSNTLVALTGSGANTYTWSNGVLNGIPFNPTVTTTYTVTGTDTNGCQNTATKSVIVNPLPTVGANASLLSVCSGTPVTLSGSDANSYTWSNDVTNGIPFIPIATTTYTVTGTDGNGCKNTASKTITVNLLPNVVADASDNSICIGMNVTLVASGANIYSWSNGVLNGIPFAPTTTTTYTVIGTDTITSCQSMATKTITVNPLPSVEANASGDSICMGSNVILSGSGATNYSWSNGVLDGISFSPTSTATYAVTGTDLNDCQNTAIITITVNQIPMVILGADIIIQQNQNTILDAGLGFAAYLWSTGAETHSIIINSQGTIDSMVTYSVTVSNISGCTAADAVIVTTIVSSNDPDDKYKISIMPNPTLDVVYIKCEGASTSTVKVIDNLGRVVAEDNAFVSDGATRTLNLVKLPPSTYYVHIVGKGFTRTASIVRQ